MTDADMRARKAQAMKEIRGQHSTGLVRSFVDLLDCELADAQGELEYAETDIAIWRAQGRTAGVRNLLAAITPKGGE